jgi:putative ABC transport system permease protein
MELSFWVGIAGLVAALLLTGLICAAAGSIGLPLVIRAPTAIFVCAMMMMIAIISGAMAMGILKKSQPADLLR